jgi:hypothetical protein
MAGGRKLLKEFDRDAYYAAQRFAASGLAAIG